MNTGADTTDTFAAPLPARPPSSRVWRRLRDDRWGLFGLLLVLGYFGISLAVWSGMAGQDWSAASGGRWQPVSAEYWFGTNVLGQDIFQRSLYSVRVAFEIGLLVAATSTLLGALLGALAGWRSGSAADDAVLFVAGVLDSIPFYLFVAAVAFAMRGNPWAMHFAMVATFWTTTCRLVRAEVMRLKSREFVQSALALGLSAPRTVLRHVLPNTVHVLLAQGAIVIVAAIKAEVILSFLGLGVHDGVSWGLMLAESTQEVLAGRFNNLLAASLPLFGILLGFNLVADALQDALDPRATPA
ncbi:ABC transporter permease [Elongatibacter sediminis]|uniref:ABC transporter permease n=1 Tax=Elongatibacter sediminis TaxID=3119006 RepID=A0AAW9R5V1_9GAMM